MPLQLKRIHSVAHLILVIGSFVAILMLISTVLGAYSHGCKTKLCLGRILPIIFVSMCLFYFLQTISHYDANLLRKKHQIQELKMDLDKCYENTVADLDICIAKSMDTNACLAEANFDSKRRDFHRFLHRMSQNLQASREDADKFERSSNNLCCNGSMFFLSAP